MDKYVTRNSKMFRRQFFLCLFLLSGGTLEVSGPGFKSPCSSTLHKTAATLKWLLLKYNIQIYGYNTIFLI